jgi:hypothetical protein
MGPTSCPACQSDLAFFDTDRGLAITCKHCQQRITIPLADAAPICADAVTQAEQRSEETTPPEGPTTLSAAEVTEILGRIAPRRRGRELVLWGAILLALLGVVGVILYSSMGDHYEVMVADLNNLSTETEVAGYLVRPPKDYPRVNIPAAALPAGARFFAWVGSKRTDGSAPAFGVNITTLPPGRNVLHEKEFNVYLKGFKQRYVNWTQSPTRKVKINNLKFLGTRWSATDAKKGWKLHGVLYVAIEGSTLIELMSQDVVPHHEEALKIGEAAASSFRKREVRIKS